MKKVFAILALMLALCFTFAGCAEKTGADYVIDALGTMVNDVEQAQITEPTRISISVADITKLCTMFGADMEGVPALQDAFMDMKVNAEGGVVDFGVTLDGTPLNLAMFVDSEKYVFASEQLSKDYGITIGEYFMLLETLSGVTMPYEYDEIVALMDPAKMEAMDARYGEKIEALLRENIEFIAEKAGKNVVVSFTLTPENAATIAHEFVNYVLTDTELFTILETVYGEELTAEVRDFEIDKEEMLSALTEAKFNADIKLTIVKKTSEIVGADAVISIDETPVTMQYVDAEDGFTWNVKGEGALIEMTSKATKDTYALMLKATEEGEEILSASLDVAEDISLSATMDGTTVGATFDYTETENSFEMTLKEVSMGGFSIDLSEVGVKMLVETGVEIPAMPEEYTSIANFTAEEFQALLVEFVMNAGLLKYMM